jgi:hypothetical protein
MKLTPKGKKIVHDSPGDRFGVYLWKMPNGAYIADEDRNFLSIASEFGDVRRIAELRAAVKSFGIDEGEPQFFPGHRKVSDEEYEEQLARASEGLVPDEYDVGFYADDLRDKANGRG